MADTSQDRDRIHRIVRSALDAHPLAGKDYPAGAYYCACGHISRIDDPDGRARHLAGWVTEALIADGVRPSPEPEVEHG